MRVLIILLSLVIMSHSILAERARQLMAIRTVDKQSPSGSNELQCYTCSSYMDECKKSVNVEGGRVSTTPCRTKCFSRRGEDNAIYRGCFDGYLHVTELNRDFVGCAPQQWNGRSLMWCFCNTNLCNGAYINPAVNLPRPLPMLPHQYQRQHNEELKPTGQSQEGHQQHGDRQPSQLQSHPQGLHQQLRNQQYNQQYLDQQQSAEQHNVQKHAAIDIERSKSYQTQPHHFQLFRQEGQKIKILKPSSQALDQAELNHGVNEEKHRYLSQHAENHQAQVRQEQGSLSDLNENDKKPALSDLDKYPLLAHGDEPVFTPATSSAEGKVEQSADIGDAQKNFDKKLKQLFALSKTLNAKEHDGRYPDDNSIEEKKVSTYESSGGRSEVAPSGQFRVVRYEDQHSQQIPSYDNIESGGAEVPNVAISDDRGFQNLNENVDGTRLGGRFVDYGEHQEGPSSPNNYRKSVKDQASDANEDEVHSLPRHKREFKLNNIEVEERGGSILTNGHVDPNAKLEEHNKYKLKELGTLKNWQLPGDANERSNLLRMMKRTSENESPFALQDSNDRLKKHFTIARDSQVPNDVGIPIESDFKSYTDQRFHNFSSIPQWDSNQNLELLEKRVKGEGKVERDVSAKPKYDSVDRYRSSKQRLEGSLNGNIGSSYSETRPARREQARTRSIKNRGDQHSTYLTGEDESTNTIPQIQCEKSGYYQNPMDCRTFIACLLEPGLQLLVLHVMDCPQGLYWDDSYKVCIEYSNTCGSGNTLYKKIYGLPEPEQFEVIYPNDDLSIHKDSAQVASARALRLAAIPRSRFSSSLDHQGSPGYLSFSPTRAGRKARSLKESNEDEMTSVKESSEEDGIIDDDDIEDYPDVEEDIAF